MATCEHSSGVAKAGLTSEVKINLMGIPFKFDSSDGQALLEIMERYKE